jgi:hypothetical protein
MSKENIYDLDAIVGKNSDVEVKRASPTIMTDADINELLVGYTLVPNSEWKSLKHYNHIRYQRKDGSFRNGGYIKNIWLNTDTNKIKIEIATNLSHGAYSWSIGLQNIEKIWRKNDMAAPDQFDASELTDKIEKLEQVCESLTREIVRMNNEQKRVLTLIKKINDKVQR